MRALHPDQEPGVTEDQVGEFLIQGIKVVAKSYEESARYEALLEHQANLPVFLQALRLVINGLCFLSAEPDDIVTAFPKEALDTLGGRSEQGDVPREMGRLEKKYERCIGSAIPKSISAAINSCKRPSTIRRPAARCAHRRRAFWRNQPYGPGQTLRKARLRQSHSCEKGAGCRKGKMLQDILTSLPLLRLANLASDDGNGACTSGGTRLPLLPHGRSHVQRRDRRRRTKDIGKQDHRWPHLVYPTLSP